MANRVIGTRHLMYPSILGFSATAPTEAPYGDGRSGGVTCFGNLLILSSNSRAALSLAVRFRSLGFSRDAEKEDRLARPGIDMTPLRPLCFVIVVFTQANSPNILELGLLISHLHLVTVS